MKRASGKTVIVTGAAKGLGAAIAETLEEAGATVVRTDIVPQDGILLHDVTSEADWQQLVASTVERHGRLDGLVNNAGLAFPTDPETSTVDQWRSIFSVNMEGVFLGCKHAVPAIARSGGGSIVNLSSVASMMPTPLLSAYGASKAAVAHYTRSLAMHCCEKGYSIRCNSVHPGQVRTPMHNDLVRSAAADFSVDEEQAAEGLLSMVPMRKWQEPIDIANGVLFLISDESRFITGTALPVDGGMTLGKSISE